MSTDKKQDDEFKYHIKALKKKVDKFLSVEMPADVLIIKTHLISEYYLNQILVLRELVRAKK